MPIANEDQNDTTLHETESRDDNRLSIGNSSPFKSEQTKESRMIMRTKDTNREQSSYETTSFNGRLLGTLTHFPSTVSQSASLNIQIGALYDFKFTERL